MAWGALQPPWPPPPLEIASPRDGAPLRGPIYSGEREATKGLRSHCSSFSPLYIGPRERGRAQPCPFLQGRVRPRGGGVHPPQGTSEVPSPFRTLPFPLLLAHGPLGAGALGPYRPRRTPLQHICPPGAGGPPRGPPDPFRHSRYNTDNARNFSGDQNKTSHI